MRHESNHIFSFMENQLFRPLTFHLYVISHNKVLYVYEVYMFVHVYFWLLFHSIVECYTVIKPLWLQYYVYVSPYPVENYPIWFEKIQILALGFQVYKQSKNRNEILFSQSKESSWTHHVYQLIEFMQPFKNYAHLYKKMIVLLLGLMKRD